MTEHELKELKNLGAELGAVKAECEKLRAALQEITCADWECDQSATDSDISRLKSQLIVKIQRIAADALSRQAEPVEPATAQDEQPIEYWVLFDATGPVPFIKKDMSDGTLAFYESEQEAKRAKRSHPGTDYKRVEYYRARPAQTEQRSAVRITLVENDSHGGTYIRQWDNLAGLGAGEHLLYAAPVAQTAPQPEQSGLYTCIGKGGVYQLIGRATTAGVLKVTGRFADEVIVYRDTESNALYCREPGDFRLRMALSAQRGEA